MSIFFITSEPLAWPWWWRWWWFSSKLLRLPLHCHTFLEYLWLFMTKPCCLLLFMHGEFFFFFFFKRVTQLLLFILFPPSLSSMGRLVVKHCNCKRTFSFFPQGNWAFLSGTHGRVDSSITFNVENKNKYNWELFFFFFFTTEMVKWKRAFSKQIALPTSEFLFFLSVCASASQQTGWLS